MLARLSKDLGSNAHAHRVPSTLEREGGAAYSELIAWIGRRVSTCEMPVDERGEKDSLVDGRRMLG